VQATGAVVKSQMGKRTYFVDEVDEDKRPFRALLDVGIVSTSTGARVFGVMKVSTAS
jgi:large subunit ribosomal protein L5e